jgi:hypothetical protein
LQNLADDTVVPVVVSGPVVEVSPGGAAVVVVDSIIPTEDVEAVVAVVEVPASVLVAAAVVDADVEAVVAVVEVSVSVRVAVAVAAA